MRYLGVWSCLDCLEDDYGHKPVNVNLHQKAGNKYCAWLTKAGNDVFTYRDKLPSGELVDRRTGRLSPQVTNH